jgi:dTDP-glucose 4,6-dehydratase
MRKVMVTGGAGFIGSHLCDHFLALGWEVVAVDNFVTGRRENIKHISNKRFSLVEQDVAEGLDFPGALDYVLHFASPASPVDYLAFPIETLRVGSQGTENALRLALAKGARFMLASTSEVYGDPLMNPQPEVYWGNVNPIGVRSVYDEAKRYAEAITMAYHRHKNLDTRIVRIFNTYGPRMRVLDGRVVPNFIRQALRGEPITVYGEGTQTRSFCYVDDLVEGIHRVLLSDRILPVNLGNPKEMTIAEFAKIVLDLVGGDSEIVFKDLPDDDPQVRSPDIGVARDLLGWAPHEALKDGLRRTVEYFKAVCL